MEWGYLNIVQVVSNIWSQREKSTRPQMLLAPGSILELLSALGGGATTFEWGRSPYFNLGTDLEAMLFKDGGDLIIVGNGTLKF